MPAGFRVLIIDDSAEDRTIVERAIRDTELDVEIASAGSGTEAHQALRESAFDCVLLDYHPSDESGSDVMRQILGRAGPPAVIMLTGQGDEQLAHQVQMAGAADYLDKTSLTPDSLGRVLRHALARQEYRRSEVALAQELLRKNAALELLSASAAHDLQAPLRHLTQAGKMLEGLLDRDGSDEARECARRMRVSTVRMQLLIDALLALAQIENAEIVFSPVSLDYCAGRALESLGPQIEEAGAQIDCGALGEARGDATLLTQLLQNLLSNALRFVGDESPEIRLEREGIDGCPVWKVTDNGIGIAVKDAERIFEPFARIHSRTRYDGTGIGLALCAVIIERHGGRIWVAADVGMGACFRFSLGANARAN